MEQGSQADFEAYVETEAFVNNLAATAKTLERYAIIQQEKDDVVAGMAFGIAAVMFALACHLIVGKEDNDSIEPPSDTPTD